VQNNGNAVYLPTYQRVPCWHVNENGTVPERLAYAPFGANPFFDGVFREPGFAVVCIQATSGQKAPAAAGHQGEHKLRKVHKLQDIEILRDLAERHGCGKCLELTALTFVYLYNLNIGPLDFMALHNADQHLL
jgi:hypothetical protein